MAINHAKNRVYNKQSKKQIKNTDNETYLALITFLISF